MAQGNGGFHWRQVAGGRGLVCPPLAAIAAHVFTTRLLPLHRPWPDDEEGRAAIAALIGVGASRVHGAHQVHGADVFLAAGDAPAGNDLPSADILLTSEPDTAVSVRVADCVPILLADRRRGAVGAVHAGWRGTREGAAMVAVRAMAERFGTAPGDLIAAIGPAIGPCCYQVGAEVREAFAARDGHLPAFASWFTRDGDRWRLDLWAANRDQLAVAGVAPDAIHVAGECTASALDRYYSFRKEGAGAGRMVAAIRPGASPKR